MHFIITIALDLRPSTHFMPISTHRPTPFQNFKPPTMHDHNANQNNSGDLVNDPLGKSPFAAPAPITQKLGPKANQGAINAGLRALDRTGKPCRKWEKKVFSIKSFTGVNWVVPTWRAPKRAAVEFNGDVKSDTTASSDTKGKDESSAISEKSNSNGDSSTPIPPNATVLASSPTPAVVVS
jgi:hypothetical protein